MNKCSELICNGSDYCFRFLRSEMFPHGLKDMVAFFNLPLEKNVRYNDEREILAFMVDSLIFQNSSFIRRNEGVVGSVKLKIPGRDGFIIFSIAVYHPFFDRKQ